MPDTPKNPLCFVLMPFGIKSDAMGRPTDFDAVYQQIIVPAIRIAGLDPVRADGPVADLRAAVGVTAPVGVKDVFRIP